MIQEPAFIWNEHNKPMPGDKRVIGVDEAGKGDFFGPLVVAGVLSKESEDTRLRTYGVRDSKLISDNKILVIDEQLRVVFPHFVIEIAPMEYNREYKKIKNLNKLLANLHAQVIKEIHSKHKADKIVIDKFGKTELVEKALSKLKIKLELFQIERGERHAPVAAASILARAGFIRAMDRLSDELGMLIPKGSSSQVDETARRIVRKFGDKALLKLSKVHFKNYNRVLSPNLFS